MDRLVAETLARLGEAAGIPAALQQRALQRAESVDGVEAKLLAYFAARPEAIEARRCLTRQMRYLRWLFTGLLLLALIAGGVTAMAALRPVEGQVVNILWALSGLIGLNLLLFALWLVVIVLLPDRPATHSLGAAAVGLWRRLMRRDAGGGLETAARNALLGRMMHPPAGRWLASCLSHGLWLGFGTGALAMCLVILSTRHIVFVWETTILLPEDFRAIITALGAAPAALGFSTPDEARIVAAEWTGGSPPATQDAAAWSGLLIGALMVYGILPRLLALAFSAGRAVRGLRRPLDLADPQFARLIPELAPVMRRSQVIDADSEPGDSAVETSLLDEALERHLPAPPPPGPVAILGWEHAPPEAGWPPLTEEAGLLDLGLLEDRSELAEAMASAREAKVVRILVACDLTVTPDRGSIAALRDIRRAAQAPPVLLLSRKVAAQRRLGDGGLRERTADWVGAAHAAGFPLDHILTLDLDRLPPEDRRSLARLAGSTA